MSDQVMSMLPTNPAPRPPAPLTPPASVGVYPLDRTGRPSPSIVPVSQLASLPKDELETLAEGYGLDATRYGSRAHLVAAIHERRQLIASLDREALLDVVRWGRRPVAANASNEQLAMEIARVRGMRFAGLSRRGLIALALLRGVRLDGSEETPEIVRRMRRAEGLLSRLDRKRRAAIARVVTNLVGDDDPTDDDTDYRFLPSTEPPATHPAATRPTANPPPPPVRRGSLKHQIEESGLIGGLTNRFKQSADSYVNQKLDEIEARIDRKLDEIDRRLAEWRDKEIANRIRILKITLWASIIVAGVSLVYAYLKVHLPGLLGG